MCIFAYIIKQIKTMKLKETIILTSEKITASINGEKYIGKYIGWPIIEKNGAICQRIIFKKT